MIVAAGSLNGCASAPDPVSARKNAYERLLSLIEPGMHRRQLYALLPPRRTPIAYPNRAFSGNSTLSVPVVISSMEVHELDREFSLFVQYRFANPGEYPNPQIEIGDISDKAIDALLFGSWSKPIKSVQNLDDEIAGRPTLMHRRRRDATTGTSSDHEGNTSTKRRADR